MPDTFTETTINRATMTVQRRTVETPTRLPLAAYSTLERPSYRRKCIPACTFVIYSDHDEHYTPEEFNFRYNYSTRTRAHYDFVTDERNARTKKDLR